MENTQDKEYRYKLAERLLISGGCDTPTMYQAFLAAHLALDEGGDIYIVDPETSEVLRHDLFGEAFTVTDLLNQLAQRHPRMLPKLREH